jgi:murein DD-endopeptidase MepM/ murein hydrolase activator NlpD
VGRHNAPRHLSTQPSPPPSASALPVESMRRSAARHAMPGAPASGGRRADRANGAPTFSAAEFLTARVSDTGMPRRTRAAERDYQRRPVWRRAPAVPAIAVTAGLVIWGGVEGTQLLTDAPAGAHKSVADVPLNLSALATDDLADSGPAEQVSRDQRRLASPQLSAEAASAMPAPLPARADPPKIQLGKTVAGTWIRPSAGEESSCFCMRWGEMHEGIDLAGPLGSPIVAVGDGVVLEAGPAAGFGHWIVVRQTNGDVTIYGHMYSVLVSAGEHVRAGQHIANIGADGESTGPHLHFGVMVGGFPNGHYIDPVPWLKARGINVGPYNPNA